MTATATGRDSFDVFLSHGSPDKPWVESLQAELDRLGLRAFLDVRELKTGENWTLRLSRELLHSRSLALVLSAETLRRPWVEHEWTSFLAAHGPTSGRLVPVLLDNVALPPFLNSLQGIKAQHHDPAKVAAELALRVGTPATLPEGDVRRLYFGQDLVFVLAPGDDGTLSVIDPTGRRRAVTSPWQGDPTGFLVARLGWDEWTRKPVETDAARAELHRHAVALGSALFDLLFDEEAEKLLDEAAIPGRPRPLVTIRSDDVRLQGLPWELLHRTGRFLIREGVVDLTRSDTQAVGPEALLREPAERLALVVNVSAPEGSGLHYEAESYRIIRALTDQCRLTPTELGTLKDLVETVERERPVGLHFSGHGGPGLLAFEDDEGRADEVPVDRLVSALKKGIPDGILPPFFYLANCHGNDPAALREGEEAVERLAARLHRDGVAQVVAYGGPILDALSTAAEVALYAAIADGHTTRHAALRAREALAKPLPELSSVARDIECARVEQHTHPFAWAQLVLYHRGPDHPLSQPVPPGLRGKDADVLHRTFIGAGGRRILSTGFIGRRTERHRIRRRIRRGDRVFVFQGLGGLGKSTLAFHVLPMLAPAEAVCALWCQEAEKALGAGSDPIAEALVGQLLDYCRKRFGLDWEGVVQQVDRTAGDDPAQRFALYLGVLLQDVPRLAVYLDNLESLLVGPAEADDEADAFAAWRSPALATIWATLKEAAEGSDKLHVVASCRYRHADFGKRLIPVSPLPLDALFRMTAWFSGLRRLSTAARAKLAVQLAGHPRAVEFANDLVERALASWEEDHGTDWPPAGLDPGREWAEIVAPALPEVERKLEANLLFDALWDRVLDDRARRMLGRMTLLRQPWDRDLIPALGDDGEGPEVARVTADRLRRTSLLETVEQSVPRSDGTPCTLRLDTLHPATIGYIARRSGTDPSRCRDAHRRIGGHYETKAKTSPYIDDYVKAGYHLFEADEYDRSFEMLVVASDWLRNHGRVREGLLILESFLVEPIRRALEPGRAGRLFGRIGVAFYALGQVERAIGYHEQDLAIAREIGDRRGEGTATGNLGLAYARLGQVERAIGYFEQALRIGQGIKDPRIIQVATAQLERLRDGVG